VLLYFNCSDPYVKAARKVSVAEWQVVVAGSVAYSRRSETGPMLLVCLLCKLAATWVLGETGYGMCGSAVSCVGLQPGPIS
jgi:hypothetical protein